MRLCFPDRWQKGRSNSQHRNDSCIGCGACESICDAVFSVDGVAQVDESAVADNMDCVKEAADACPVSAIEVE